MARSLGTKNWTVGEVATASNFNAYIGPPPNVLHVNALWAPSGNTNWSSLVAAAGSVIGNTKKSSGAQNDLIYWDLVLAGGTWTFELAHLQYTDRGQYEIALSTDGTTFTLVNASPYSASTATIEGYASGTVLDKLDQITSITIANTGRYTLRIRMASKNASSSSYFGSIYGFSMFRTA